MDNMIIQYLRQQAWAANAIADRLEKGEPIDDLIWTSDLRIEWMLDMEKIHGQLELNHEYREAIERRTA